MENTWHSTSDGLIRLSDLIKETTEFLFDLILNRDVTIKSAGC